jgi:hypothetical protein
MQSGPDAFFWIKSMQYILYFILAIMAYVVASVFFFGVITFVTVCTEVDATQERSHAGNHIKDDMCCARVIITAKAKIDGHKIIFDKVVVSMMQRLSFRNLSVST